MAKAPIVEIPTLFVEGEPLTEQDYRDLETTSWISREIADAAMLRRVPDHEGRRIVGQRSRACSGIVFSYFWPGNPRPLNFRLRRDTPEMTQSSDGSLKPDKKYLGSPGARNAFYIPLGITLEDLANGDVPIVLTEGEKKALALWRLANHGLDSPRFIPIAIPGVWNWRGTIGKTGGPKGERLDVRGPIFDFDLICWKSRKVSIVFDRNVHTNESVSLARRLLSKELVKREALVNVINLPEDCGVNGVDDLLAAWGPQRVLELFKNAGPLNRLHVVASSQYSAKPEGLFRVSGKGEVLTQSQLTNYSALVVANVVLDDGLTQKREFEIKAELNGRPFSFVVSASEFARMDWDMTEMGSEAITFPNQKEYARTAIQSLSLTPEERYIYAHTGWRQLDQQWVFLHGGGAVTASGMRSEVAVRLPGAINRYQLNLPGTPIRLVSAMRASLRLLELAPPAVSFPLLAATCCAVFGDADFGIHLVGATGSFKSEIAALHQQHFGVEMNRNHLPGSWSSTANALETIAFHAKDVLLVIDDFAPQGSGPEVSRYHAAADRVFRAIGNSAGRSRLDSTATLKPPKPPRALILSTGEDIPRGQSIRARMLILEIAKGDVTSAKLSACQDDAQAEIYGHAMTGFVQWLAGDFEEKKESFKRRSDEYRALAVRNPGHARTPDIVARLQAGLRIYLQFALDIGAIDLKQQEELLSHCWKALSEASDKQAAHQLANEPASQYLALLRSSLITGKAYLASRTGDIPEISPESCGWRRDAYNTWKPYGDCIGWVDENNIYIDPTAAHRCVQMAARDSGEAPLVAENTLRKRLHEKGLLASVDDTRQTLTIRRTLAGSSKKILHFLRSTILQESSDADEEAND